MDQAYVDVWGPGPHEAADVIVIDENRCVLMILREDGSWALPGGFLNPEEDPMDGAIREALEETNVLLDPTICLGSIRAEGPDRDPRAHINTTAFVFRMPENVWPVKGPEVKAVLMWPTEYLPTRVYADHRDLIRQGVEILEASCP